MQFSLYLCFFRSLHWTHLWNISCAIKKAYAIQHFLFIILLRKLCGSVAEGLRKLKSHFAIPEALSEPKFVEAGQAPTIPLCSLWFLIFVHHFYYNRDISFIKKCMCCGSLRKLCGSSPRKRKSKTCNKYICCGSLRKVFRGSENSRHQKTHVLRKLAESKLQKRNYLE